MHRSRSRLVALVLCLAGTPGSSGLLAQAPRDVQVGQRVRIWLPEQHRQLDDPVNRQVLRGTVTMTTPDALQLTLPGLSESVSIPRGLVRRLDVSRGAPSRPASAVERAVSGAVGGAILWALMNDPRRSGGPHYDSDWTAAGTGAAWGAALGGAVGFMFPHERWDRLRKRHWTTP